MPRNVRCQVQTVARCAAALSVVLLGVACDPTPTAKVFVMGDSNMALGETVFITHFFKDRPYLTTAEVWAGLGTQNDEPLYRDDFAVDRVGMAVDALDPDYVVTNIGVNDVGYGVDAFVDGARRYLDAIGPGVRVIWIAPAIAGTDQTTVAALVGALVDLQDQYDNLWVIPYDAVIDSVAGDSCPTVIGTFELDGPRSACYVDRDNNVHLSYAGTLILAAMVRVYLDAAEEGGFRSDPVAIASQIYDHLLALQAS